MSNSKSYYVANCIERILMAAGSDMRNAIEGIAVIVSDERTDVQARHDLLIELVSDWESTRKKYRQPPAHPDQG